MLGGVYGRAAARRVGRSRAARTTVAGARRVGRTRMVRNTATTARQTAGAYGMARNTRVANTVLGARGRAYQNRGGFIGPVNARDQGMFPAGTRRGSALRYGGGGAAAVLGANAVLAPRPPSSGRGGLRPQSGGMY